MLLLAFKFTENFKIRLREEGYVQPKNSISSPTQTEETETATVIETVTLKGSTEKLLLIF